jgi:hypothetical protein
LRSVISYVEVDDATVRIVDDKATLATVIAADVPPDQIPFFCSL